MAQVTVKTSTIFIAKGNHTQIFHSVSEIPAPLRKQLEDSTNSFNSATILIADRRGKREILKALEGLPSHFRARLAASMGPAGKTASGRSGSVVNRTLAFFRTRWLELSLPFITGLIIWALLNWQ